MLADPTVIDDELPDALIGGESGGRHHADGRPDEQKASGGRASSPHGGITIPIR